MAKKLTTYYPAKDLTSVEAIASFIAEPLKKNDASYIAHALGVVARSKGMTEIAGETGLSREQLYRASSENGNPALKTALGVELTTKASAVAWTRAAGVRGGVLTIAAGHGP